MQSQASDAVVQRDRKGQVHRYQVLDALRGICACGVVFFHFHTTGLITNSAFARGSWMFVDFFFVLSGFVIYASYGQRLREGYSVGRFMGLRLGRVYPMYFVALLLFAAMEVLLLAVPSLASREAFTGRMDWDLGLLNVTLTQIFGVVRELGWNGPGWSIAAEVWAYLLLAFVLKLTPRNPWPAIGLIMVGSIAYLFWLGEPWLDRTYIHALPRCLFGFCLGMALYRFGLGGPQLGKGSGTALEALAIIVCVAMVSYATGAETLAAPFIFAAAIWVFAREAGVFSRIFSTWFFTLLGLLSYSIYIVHVFVQARFRDVLLVSDRWNMPWDIAIRPDGGQEVAGPWWLADLLTLVMLAGVIIFAYITYHLVEAPARRWSRKLLVKDR